MPLSIALDLSIVRSSVVTPKPTGVVSVLPTAESTDVAIATTMQVVFLDEINETTLVDHIIVTADDVEIDVSYILSGDTLTITPVDPLPQGAVIEVTLLAGIENTKGGVLESNYVWSFTTAEALTVVSVGPLDEATDIYLDSHISAVFSAGISEASLSGRVAVTADSTPITGVVSVEDNILTFVPTDPLLQGAVIEVTLSAGIESIPLGQYLASDYVWSFTAISALSVVSVDPADEETEVAKDSVITVTFNHDVTELSLSGKIIVSTSPDGETYTPVDVTYELVDNVLTITPGDDFPVSAYVSVELSSGITGEGGCSLESDYIWSFNVAANFYMFKTNDSLQPVAGVDFSPGLTHTFLDPNEEEDLLSEEYRLYGTHCLKLGGGRAWRITGAAALLANCLKNQLFNIYIPASTDTTFSILNILDSEDASLCNIAYNANSGVLSVGSAVTAGSIITGGQYNTFQFIESSGNYTLKINGTVVSLTGTQAVPTSDIAKLLIGDSTTDVWYFDTTIFAK